MIPPRTSATAPPAAVVPPAAVHTAAPGAYASVCREPGTAANMHTEVDDESDHLRAANPHPNSRIIIATDPHIQQRPPLLNRCMPYMHCT